MKTTLAVFALALTLSTSAFAGDRLVYTVKGHEVLTLKKISKTRFTKISQVVTGQASLDYITAKGVKNLSSQEINEASEELVSLEVTGKNVVRLIDIKENINKEIPATVNTSLFGSVKAITVSAQTMEGLYAASMKKSGLDTLRNLRLLGGAISSSIVSTDMKCAADGDLLICQQDQTLTLLAQ